MTPPKIEYSERVQRGYEAARHYWQWLRRLRTFYMFETGSEITKLSPEDCVRIILAVTKCA